MKFYTLDNQFIEEKDYYSHPFTGIIEYSNGCKLWLLNGKYHRLDGPAVEYATGTKEWFFEDKRHRLDGPAVEWKDGPELWYINGKEVSEEQHKLLVSIMKLKGLL